MKKAIKGALFSGLVFPGVGQILLKQYARGVAFLLAVTAGLAIIIVKATQQAFVILEDLQSAGGNIDMTTVSEIAAKASNPSAGRIVNFCLFVIMLCWIVSTIDAYFIGKRMDAEADRPPQPPTLPSP